MHVDAPTRELRVHLVLRQVLIAAERGDAHSKDVHRRSSQEFRNQIGAGDASAPQGLVDDDCAVWYVAAIPITGIGDPVIDDVRRHRSAIPKKLVKVGDVNDGNPPIVGHRMSHLVNGALWNVVFEIDGRQVGTGLNAQPLANEIEIAWPLQNDDVEGDSREFGRHKLHRGGRPVPRPRTAKPVAGAVVHDRNVVPMRSLHERRRVRAVDMPQKYVHEANSIARRPTSDSIASTTASGVTSARQGCPSMGQTCARQFAHGAAWSPSIT